MTITERLAEHIVSLRFDDIPEPVVEKAKDQLAHHLGLALRACNVTERRPATALALELSGGGGDYSLVGEHRRADLLDAIFVNSTLMGHDDLDDFVLPPGIHPGVVLAPTAWAVGEGRRISGRELLAAFIAGYDVMDVLGRQVWTWTADPPRRPNTVFAPFGGAAVAARLLGLSRTETVHALGFAGNAGMGIAEGVDHLWTMHPLLARQGTLSAMLAKWEAAAPATIVEGRNGVYRSFFRQDVPDSMRTDLAMLGRDFAISKAESKRVPASGFNIIPIELTQRLVKEHALTLGLVDTVEVALPVEREQRETALEDAAGASSSWDPIHRFSSLRYRVASVLASKGDDANPYEHPDDPDFQAVLGRVRLRFEHGRPLRYARIELTTTSGRRHTADAETHVPEPVDRERCLTAAAGPLFSVARLTELAELIDDLDRVADVSRVTALFPPDARGAG